RSSTTTSSPTSCRGAATRRRTLRTSCGAIGFDCSRGPCPRLDAALRRRMTFRGEYRCSRSTAVAINVSNASREAARGEYPCHARGEYPCHARGDKGQSEPHAEAVLHAPWNISGPQARRRSDFLAPWNVSARFGHSPPPVVTPNE